MAKIVELGTDNITFCKTCSSLIKFDESDVMVERCIITQHTQSFVLCRRFVLCPHVGCGEPCKVNIKEVK